MSGVSNIAIFLPNWLGDLVMATPALRSMRRHFASAARLVGILRPHLTELLAGTDWLDEQWAFDPRSQDRNLRTWALARRFRRERFDMAVLLTNSLRTAAVAWLGDAEERIGYVRYGRGPLLTGKLYPRRAGRRFAERPMVDTYLELARAVGCPVESPRLELATTEAEERLADRIWRDLGLRTDGRIIALNSSGAYGAAKLWPAEHFGGLARRIADELDHDVLVICGARERQLADEIAGRADHRRVFSLADQRLGLGTTKSCLRRSRLTVSTDSGPRHVAAAFGKPVITLLGPTRPVWIENPTVRGSFLQLELDCIGCAKRVCPLGHHRCMRELSVARVYAEVAKLLEEKKPSIAA